MSFCYGGRSTTGDDMVTATNATIRKWTKWITARESVVKVRYISTNQETHAFVSINPAIGQSTTGLCQEQEMP
jgi:hypothetical protein